MQIETTLFNRTQTMKCDDVLCGRHHLSQQVCMDVYINILEMITLTIALVMMMPIGRKRNGVCPSGQPRPALILTRLLALYQLFNINAVSN